MGHQPLERGSGTEVAHVGLRERRGLEVALRFEAREGDQPLGFRVGELAQQHGIDDRERADAGGEPEREREAGDRGEGRAPREATGRVAMILQCYELYPLAFPWYERARALDREPFRWVYYLATAHAATGEDPASLTSLLREAVRLKPDYLPARLRLSEALLAQGYSPEVLATAQELVQRAPQSARAHYLAGRAQESAGNLEPAAEHYRKACALAGKTASTSDWRKRSVRSA